jgi:hypothetical protein
MVGPPSDDDDITVRDEPTAEDITQREGSAAVGPPVLGEEPPAMAYAVHTHTCTYLLDEEGICRWIVARQGAVPPHVRQCMGAQFVACLDLAEQGGLTGELRQGAMGLFVRPTDPGRMVLLRTAPILAVDGLETKPGERPKPPAFGDRVLERGTHYGKRAGMPVGKPPAFSSVQTWGSEQTVTVSPSSRDPGSDRQP